MKTAEVNQKSKKISVLLSALVLAVLILLPHIVQTLHIVLVEHEEQESTPVSISSHLNETHWRCPVFDVDIQPRIIQKTSVFNHYIPVIRIFLHPGEYIIPVNFIRHFWLRGPPFL